MHAPYSRHAKGTIRLGDAPQLPGSRDVGPVTSVAVAPDGRWLASSGNIALHGDIGFHCGRLLSAGHVPDSNDSTFTEPEASQLPFGARASAVTVL